MTGPHPSIKYLLLVWLAGYTGLCYAASLFEDMTSLDWPSVGAAAVAGIFGGLLKTILILSSRKVLVLDVLRQCWRDMLVAMVGAILAYGAILVAAATGFYTVPGPARMLILVAVGFSRGRWQGLVEALSQAARKKAGSLLGVQVSDTKPSSAFIPLEDTRR